MFNAQSAYARLPDPAETGRILLVQGDVAVWEGWPPSDAFPAPDWAKDIVEDTKVPLDLEARAQLLSDKLAKMRAQLKEAEVSVKRPVKDLPVKKT